MKIKIFNLDDNSTEVKYDLGIFSGGEIRVRIDTAKVLTNVRIEAYIFNSDDVMTLIMLVDALRQINTTDIRLTIPYLPYARQDRVCNPGEAFSSKVFAGIINSLNFESVVVWDPHSENAIRDIKKCLIVPQYELMRKHVDLMNWLKLEPVYLIAPDKGSIHKTDNIATVFSKYVKRVLYADKVRELSTGKIIRTEIKGNIPEDFSSSRVLICDDICDFGTTFVELSKVLKHYNPKEMSLYVTHGIFSGGKNRMLEYFDNVWCSLDFEYKWNSCLNKFTNS
jgi:ribose-phosphate pyrophosphokinase